MNEPRVLIPASSTSPSVPSAREFLSRHWLAFWALGGLYVALFWPVLSELGRDLAGDEDLSYGFLVPVISAGLLWARRRELAAERARRSWWGLGFLLGSLLVFFAGYITLTNVLQRAGMWGVLVGAIWYALGTGFSRRAAFPLVYLVCTFPPPRIFFAPLRLELKGLATRMSADLLGLTGLSAFPEGNILLVGEHRLEVADACSGIRSLLAILATALLFAYLFRTGWLKGSLLVATAVPVTVLINVLRIVIVASALVWLDVDLTAGAAHDAVGYAVFALSLGILYGIWRFYDWLLRWKTEEARE